MLVSLTCTSFWIHDLPKHIYFVGSYSQKVGVFPTLQDLEIVNNSFAMVFAWTRVMFDILEHPQPLTLNLTLVLMIIILQHNL